MAEASHHDWRAVSELVRAKTLIAALDYDSAAAIYQSLLATELPDTLRIEAQTNLVAALCAMAQDKVTPADIALSQLQQAEQMQMAALKSLDRHVMRDDWVLGRANLALIYLARHRITGDDHEVLRAHIALDGAETTLRQTDDAELLNWVGSIRDYLAEQRKRRSGRR